LEFAFVDLGLRRRPQRFDPHLPEKAFFLVHGQQDRNWFASAVGILEFVSPAKSENAVWTFSQVSQNRATMS